MKTLSKLLKYGIYLSAFMPLVIFSQYISPFHFGKVIVFRSLIEILTVLYVALIIIDRSYLPKSNKIFWSITIFTGIFGLATLTSLSIYQSFWGTLERMGGWYTFLHFWIFYIILTSVIRTREEWFTLIKISVFVSLISTLYGFLQKTDIPWVVGSGGRARIFGTIGNTALFAGYELLNVFLALLLVFKPDLSKNQKYFFGTVVILNLIAVLSTAVRGSILAVVVSAIVFALLYPAVGSGYRKIRKAILLVIALAIVAEIILVLNHNTNFVKQSGYLTRISDVSTNTYTVNTRLWAWQAGIDGWNDSIKTMLVGWGPENFNIPFSKHFNPKFYNGPGSETLFDRAHNMFMEVLVTMGILGLLSYVVIFAALFYALFKILRFSQSKEQRVYSAVLISGLVAYIIHNAFIFDTSANFLVFFITVGFINRLITPIASVTQPSKSRGAKANYGLSFTITCLLLIGAIVLIYKTNIKPARANYASTRGVIASWANDHTTSVKKFREALDNYGNSLGQYEIRHRYMQYLLENYDKLTPKETAQQVVLDAIEDVRKNLSFKEDYLPYLYVSRAYIVLGKNNPRSPYNDLALENSAKALEISPTFVRSYYEVAQAYLNKNDFANAIAAFRKATELNPEVGISYWYWGATEIEAGNEARGLELINEALSRGYSLTEAEYGKLLNLYIKKNDLPKIAEIYKKLVALKPDNAQYHASLAVAYARLGRIDEAVAAAKKAAEVDPSFEPEARAFVQSLGRQW